jgi:membrane associated rhomboid family serine protease
MAVPAVFMLGLWILVQLVNGFGSVVTTTEDAGGGVAYLAHIGGFIAGLVLAPLMGLGTEGSPGARRAR